MYFCKHQKLPLQIIKTGQINHIPRYKKFRPLNELNPMKDFVIVKDDNIRYETIREA